ncbi:dTDP-4-dehydrorhamnose reductase [Mycetocola tolaasinivorans]|uniref:dTDP-4-dehydrorhamnose reductase n=1 Tax=Mycetocola tolaasinivorans TaxID=76635 RepID=A0A3L7A9C7_9MICO|nr:dTDP-4-dehydrorhamnose reductase [Mycetocola tolaasinivorans]RLP75982.1 dTDP-4-dehydrorhamnose reductase [Mycetocola tolaasinivorans]
MRYLITGAAGMLGRDLSIVLAHHDVTALGREDLDITDQDAVHAAVAGHDVVINCAAYTAVDAAETDEDAAYAVNALGPRNLAIAAAAHGAKLIHISTDYVFAGNATEPYAEDTARAPLNAYGRTKAAGEEFVLGEHPRGGFIVRTAWIYGEYGNNFAATMLRLSGSHPTVSVVTDQIGQPTWTRDLAAQLVLLAESDAPAGVYHGTNAGSGSWFDFTRAIFTEAGLDPERVLPTDSASFVRPAPRPAFSVLGHAGWAAAGLPAMRDWREALHEAIQTGAITAPEPTQ